MDARQLKTHQDSINSGTQIGRIYWNRCEDNPNYFRTIRIVRNAMTGHIQTQISNITAGEPPDGMEEIPATLKSRLMSCNNALPFN